MEEVNASKTAIANVIKKFRIAEKEPNVNKARSLALKAKKYFRLIYKQWKGLKVPHEQQWENYRKEQEKKQAMRGRQKKRKDKKPADSDPLEQHSIDDLPLTAEELKKKRKNTAKNTRESSPIRGDARNQGGIR